MEVEGFLNKNRFHDLVDIEPDSMTFIDGYYCLGENRKQLCSVNFEQFDDVAKLARQVNFSLQQETQKFDL